jgi:hypothetical protein
MSKQNTIKIRLFYPDCTTGVVAYGHTPYVYGSKNGPMCDMEAQKKSLTDAIKKALSMLGFSADIFLGEWDDQNYIDQRVNEERLEKAENKTEEALKQSKEYDEWLANHLGYLETAVTLHELEKLYQIIVIKCRSRKDDKAVIKATRIKDKQKTILTTETDEA